MTNQSSTENWQLQDGGKVDDKWLLQESEQTLTEQWHLDDDEFLEPEWQPVEYVKPSRPVGTWILPAIITVVLLAVLGYVGFAVLSDAIPGLFSNLLTVQRPPEPTAEVAIIPDEDQEEPSGTEIPPEGTIVVVEPDGGTPVVVEGATPVPTEPEATPTATFAPPTQPAVEPPTDLVEREFATVTELYGVNAREAPNTSAPIIRVLEQNQTFFVLGRTLDGWLEIFVNDTAFGPGQPISGTVGFAVSEYFTVTAQMLPKEFVDDVLQSTGQAAFEDTLTLVPTATPTAAGGAGAAPATDDSLVTVTVNAPSGLYARQDPDPALENVIQLLPDGTSVTAVGRSANNEWLLVELPVDELEGWVLAEFLTIEGDIASLPVPGEEPEPPAPTPIPSPTPAPITNTDVITTGIEPPAPYTSIIPADSPAVVVTSPEGVDARETAGTDEPAFIVIPQGAALPATAQSADGGWLQVELPNTVVVWVERDAVTASGDVDSLPSIDTGVEETSGADAEPTPTPEADTPPADEGDEVSNTDVTTDTATTDETTEDGVTAEVRIIVAQVYAEPSTEDSVEVISRVARGVDLVATGRTADGDWIQVESEDGSVGWVQTPSVVLSAEIETLPIVE